mgnify:CR=1 FL=1
MCRSVHRTTGAHIVAFVSRPLPATVPAGPAVPLEVTILRRRRHKSASKPNGWPAGVSVANQERHRIRRDDLLATTHASGRSVRVEHGCAVSAAPDNEHAGL